LMADPLMRCHTHQMIHRCSTSFASLGAVAATQSISVRRVNKNSYTIFILKSQRNRSLDRS
jgi:hypothetical protein